ncbi:MAG TPA: hypothetical protein PKO44_06625 [Candidatus Omnitrophota bacterium]|nr:hypothetical protein [Candidatus Omnitrophota bacterium]
MLEKICKKSCYITGMLCFGVLIGLVVFLSNFEVTDFDLWLHLKTGEVIVEQGFIPIKDIFSCTMAGQPWNNHSWLFQVIFYLALSIGGLDGLFMAQVVVVAFTFLFLFLLSDIRRRHCFTVFLLFLLAMIYQSRMTMRPDLLSLLFFVVYVYILSLHLDKRLSLWVLVGVQILWVNVHGFFIFGPLLVLLGILCELIKRHVKLPWQWNDIGRLTNDELTKMKVLFVFTSLACLVNPQHIHGALYPFSVLWQVSGDSRIFFSHIQELQRPILFSDLWTLKHIAYKALIFISGCSFIVNRRRIDLSALFLWVLLLAFSLQAVRNILFFGVVACIVTILNFSEYALEDILPFRFKDRTFRYITIAMLNIIMIFWIVRYGLKESQKIYFNFDQYEMKSYYGGINLRAYPWAASRFINDNGIKGNFFNDFNSGAFLIGRCSPQVRVFIDGRTEFYGPQFFQDYVKIWDDGDEAAFLRAAEKYQLIGVFLSSSINHIGEKILQHLYKNEQWALVYLDHDAVIFLKKIPCHQALIQRFQKDKKSLTFSDIDLQRLGPRDVFPYREIKRAYALESLGLDDLARDQISRALLAAPDAPEAYYIRGKIWKKNKELHKAFEDFRLATMLAGRDANMRYQLALMYAALGDHKEAVRQFKILQKHRVRKPKVFFGLAGSLAALKEDKNAIQAMRKGLSFYPEDLDLALEAADTLMHQKRYMLAIEFYGLISLAYPRESSVYRKIGLCYKSLGQYKKAQEAFLRGLKIDPVDRFLRREAEEIKRSL